LHFPTLFFLALSPSHHQISHNNEVSILRHIYPDTAVSGCQRDGDGVIMLLHALTQTATICLF